jgi:hypothetical protein
MLRLTGEQSTGHLAIKASSSFAAFAPHWYCKLRPDEADCFSGAPIPHRHANC